MNRLQDAQPLRKPEYWLVLCAVSLIAVCYYGLRAAAVCGLAAVTAVLTDLICLFLRGRSYRLVDLTNIGSALILVLMFPATIPYSIVILSTVFAVAVGTHVFGYRKDHLFPPAAVGYLFALLNWRQEVLQFPHPGARLMFFGNDVAVSPSFSAAVNESGRITDSVMDVMLGTVSSPMGTGCLLILVVGILVLLFRRQLSPWAIVGYLVGMMLMSAFCLQPIVPLLVTNMILFSVLFLVADPSVLPGYSLASYFGTMATGILTVYLIVQFHLEYAPVVAVMLTAPLWRGLDTLEARINAHLDEADEEVQEDA